MHGFFLALSLADERRIMCEYFNSYFLVGTFWNLSHDDYFLRCGIISKNALSLQILFYARQHGLKSPDLSDKFYSFPFYLFFFFSRMPDLMSNVAEVKDTNSSMKQVMSRGV